MSFVHPLLLSGLLLVGVPVLLHLIMRQKPKHLLFPAFRFLLQKHRTNQRKLRLRHLLLLFLRMLLIVAICLALARPKVLNERLSSNQPVAAVFIVDTSASMEYTVGGKTRLDEAKRRALELLEELPEGSRIAILDTAEPISGQWLVQRSLLQERIAALRIRPANGPATTQIAEAYRLFTSNDPGTDGADDTLPRFLYVFSDRTLECWDASRLKQLQEMRDHMPAPKVQAVFVDVGVEQPQDLAITSLELPRQAVPANVPVFLRATVQATGRDYDAEIVCRIDGEKAFDRKPVKLPAGRSEVITFERLGLAPGLHQAEVKLEPSDSLLFNNVAFATFEIRGARQVLTLTDDPDDAAIWKLALEKGETPFQCTVQSVQEAKNLGLKDLAPYQVVCLLNVAQPSNNLWQLLERYVQNGGGLAVIPGGENLNMEWYNESNVEPKKQFAQRLLPGRFKGVVAARNKDGVVWDDTSFRHPVLGWFQEWSRNPSIGFLKIAPRVTRYWEVEPNPEGSVLVKYADADKADARRPALLERTFDRRKVRGRVLFFTVPLDDEHCEANRRWHDYLQALVPFYVALAKKTVGYLAGDSEDTTFNYKCGQAVPVPLPSAPRFPTYTIQGPGVNGAEAVVTRPENQSELLLTQAVMPGNFTVVGADGKTTAGFSLNVPPGESQLGRVPEDQIEALFGPRSVLPVDQTINLKEVLQSHWPQPVELFPWLMLLVLLALAVENLLANKFYRRELSVDDKVTR